MANGYGSSAATLRGHSQSIHRVATNGSGRLLASGSADGLIALWEADGQPLATLRGHTGVIYGVALSDDGRLLASGGLDGTARLWDTTNGELLRTFEPNAGPVYGVALSRNGRLPAASTAEGVVSVWTLRDHEVVGAELWCSSAFTAARPTLRKNGHHGTDRRDAGAARRSYRAWCL